MNLTISSLLSRRDVLRAGIAGGAVIALGATVAQSADAAPILKAIPSSGEKIPVIGLGTNAYGVTDAAELAARKEVLQRMSSLGGRVIDTAHAYGRSEEVIGELLASLGNRNDYFLATKTPMGSIADAKAAIDESFRRLRTDHIELLQVHNMNNSDQQLPAFREYKQSRKIRYLGVTTSQDGHYDEMLRVMRGHALDFIQVDYSLGNRSAEEKILPLAQERGIAVLANVPLGGRRGSLISNIGDKPLPPWASEIGATSWAQLLLKYVVSHPAVTCAIPGTTKLKHAQDNQGAGRGALPDAGMRKKVEQLWESMPG
ncbi:MAG TPA: aldo/keto reductase [Steroidobacteraceae bacterium]|jgi:aryl-alcohol dehydrogenase-like predicted oxidoreductase|nr:aldo/keto reductase [Steroidobacteraceae bacterium]